MSLNSDGQEYIAEKQETFTEDFELAKKAFRFAADILVKELVPIGDIFKTCIMAYYCKIIMDYKAIIILLKNGLIDQARVVLRTMLEKLFILKGIISDGNLNDYTKWNILERKAVIDNARKGYVGLENIRENADILEQNLRKQASDHGVDYDKDKSISTFEWAKKADMLEWNNLRYKQLSSIVHGNDNIFFDSTFVDEKGVYAISLLPNSDSSGEYLSNATEILLQAHKAVANQFGLTIPQNEFYDMFEL